MERVVVSHPEEWAELCSTSFVRLGVASVDDGFRAGLGQVRLGDGVRVTDVSSNGSTVYRSRSMIVDEPADDLLFAVHGSGRGTVRQDGREARLSRGRATLYDTAFPYELRFGAAMTERVLQVPRARIDPFGRLASRVTAVSLSTADRRIEALLHLMTDAVRSRETDADAGALAPTMIMLLRSVVDDPGGRARTGGTEEIHAEAIVLIDRRATAPSTSPDTIAHELGVSVRTLQSSFSRHGETVADRIRRVRVDVAVDLVTRGVPVSEAAHRAGFTDVGTCTRAVRRYRGETPSDIARAAASVVRR